MDNLREPSAQVYLNCHFTKIKTAVSRSFVEKPWLWSFQRELFFLHLAKQCHCRYKSACNTTPPESLRWVVYFHLRCNWYRSQRRYKEQKYCLSRPWDRTRSARQKYSPLAGLTCMRFLMWALRSFARISVYPEWMASSRTSWIKTYCSSTWTMMFLSRRNDMTNPNTSTVFSAAMRCSMESTTINVPVLPTPALQWTT